VASRITFENWVLKRIFGLREAGKQHRVELRNLYASPNIIRVIKSRTVRWAGHVARMGEMRNACIILVAKPERNRPLGNPRCRWEDNIRMDLMEMGWEGVDWMHLAKDRDQWRVFVNTVMNFRIS
jgi:hypothetical protein